MKKLPLAKRAQILSMLVEGSSMRAISRVCDVSINTVSKLLVDAGEAAEAFHNRTVLGLKTKQLQCDEIWAFCYAKQRTVRQMPEDKYIPGAGDIWTFTALDRDSKLMVSWFSGDRDVASASVFLRDASDRIETPVQVTTDAWPGYKDLVSEIFPWETSYGQVQKVYTNSPDKGPAKRYSPGVCCGAERKEIFGQCDYSKISTSHVERMNLNIRTGNRRFTRLTNAFSKKMENHAHALALYFVSYNFCRVHKSLNGQTPAQAAGLTDERLSMEDIARMVDAHHRPKPAFKVVTAKDGSYSVSMTPNAYAPKMSVRGFGSETEAQDWIDSKSEAWFADVCARV
jgi:IS1 family transposase/lambda repressor-like predicted transcriptional regulator